MKKAFFLCMFALLAAAGARADGMIWGILLHLEKNTDEEVLCRQMRPAIDFATTRMIQYAQQIEQICSTRRVKIENV